MNFQVLVISAFILTSLIIGANYAYALENLPISSEKRESFSSKIHPILIQWQTSENQDAFAKNYNLSNRDGKVGVYIYLNNTESKSKISPEILVTASDDRIVAAFVTSEQLEELSKLDFVERIALPDLVRTLPIPKEGMTEIEFMTEDRNDYLIWLAIGGIAVFTIIVILKRKHN